MKKWKTIRIITVAILIAFIGVILWNLISAYTAKVSYPYPALGVDINNWLDRFYLNISFVIYIFGIPMIIDVILIIVSMIKIKNNKNNK